MLLMSISRVTTNDCDQHALVHLRDGAGERHAHVLIDIAVGRAIIGELQGRPCPHAEAIDLLQASLAALGAHAERVELRCAGDGLNGVLCLRGLRGPAMAIVDPCHALLAACRMKLPVMMAEEDVEIAAAASSVPAIYHTVLAALDLDSLGNTPPGSQSA